MVLSGLGPHRPGRIQTTLDAALQADIAGILQTHRAALDRHGAANVAVVVLDNLRGEWLAWEGSGDYFDAAHGGAINGPSVPQAARICAQAVYLRARVREGFHSRQRPARRSAQLPDRAARRCLQPEKLRRPLPWSATGPRGAGRLGECACRFAGLGRRRPGSAAVPATGWLHDFRSDRGVLRARPDARKCRGQARRARGRVLRVRDAAASGAGRPI